MKTIKMTLAAAGIILLTNCNQSAEYSPEMENSTAAESESSYVTQVGNAEKDRKFIRTANLKFKVRDVSKATENIEDITLKNKGFITYTNLASNISNTNTTAISKDSSLITTYYNVTNDITIRVPNTLLDTTLREIARNIEFMDYRLITAEDVAIQMLSNQLAQQRNSGKNIPDGEKVKSNIMADEHNIRKREAADEAKIANLSLNDKVSFSTVQLSLYQNPTIRREVVSNEKNIDAYTPGLFSRLADSLQTGWEIIEDLLVFITQFWVFILIGVACFFLYRKYGKQIKDNLQP